MEREAGTEIRPPFVALEIVIGEGAQEIGEGNTLGLQDRPYVRLAVMPRHLRFGMENEHAITEVALVHHAVAELAAPRGLMLVNRSSLEPARISSAVNCADGWLGHVTSKLALENRGLPGVTHDAWGCAGPKVQTSTEYTR